MIVPALLIVAVSSADAGASATPNFDSFTADMSAMILDGRDLAPDYRHLLMEMSPTDRLQAIIFLRRSGLLKGGIWSMEDVLRPPVNQASDGAGE